ncbi:sodium:calcium antiporter [Salicibibacter cibarius]|uniref:Sodium:calcium antiporter n=1 Tax=Salicibibacter cibarius TaxID=2743000 RepID=A0A7T6Z120_9BACI|nr:sodium:calcium antiporter [Salicibibacter cibarius]QQK74964.1 sodium:calcium antiporter [Salicibibacter cibarius]
MIYILFILAIIVTVFAAIKISAYSDAISRLSGMGSLLIGTFLLAGATSLPEVTTSVSAIYLNNPDLAVGNVIGSNLFNLLILAVFDVIYRQRKVLTSIDRQQRYTALFGFIMMAIVPIALFFTLEIPFFNVGLDTLLIIALYLLSLWVMRRKPAKEEKVSGGSGKERYTLKEAVIGFFAAAITILIAGTLLTYAGDQIAVITGLGSSFVGSFLIATTTSLPEAMTVFIAFKLNNSNLAAASIIGSNLFNLLILCLCDFLYEGSILQSASSSHTATSVLLTVNSAILCYAIFSRNGRNVYLGPSIAIIFFYFIAAVWMFIL